MASSSVETNKLSSGAKQSSSPDDFRKSKNRLLSSSSSLSENNSSPDSPLGDPFGEEEEEKLLQFSQGRLSSVGDDDDAPQINNRNFHKNVSETSLAKRDESPTGKLPVTGDLNSDNNVHLALESPPNQVMERSNTATTAAATTTSPYRIPSHVFKRSKSNTPVEWSLTSNESLFSIQMGNMSFTKEQFLLWRLDDVGTPGEFSASGNLKFNCSGPLPPPPPPPPRASGSSKSVDASCCKELGHGEGTEEVVPKQSTVEDDHSDVKEKPAAAVFSPEPPRSHRPVESDDGKAIRGKMNNEPASGTPRKDFSPKENNSDGTEKRFSGAHISRMSAESNNSTKSFAFPILEGADKGTSISISSSPKLGRDPLRIHSQTVSTSKKHQVVTDQRQSDIINSSPEAMTQPKRGSGWLSCLSSCSCCR